MVTAPPPPQRRTAGKAKTNPNSMTQKPNVIQVIADQHNANWLGCAGHPQAQTPHLDRFAAEGARFDAAYTQNPICTPSRTSILSGQYCHNTGCYGLGGPKPVQLPSFMGHFRKHGYRTAAFGKLHLPCEGGNWLADDLDQFGDSYETIEGEYGKSAYLADLEAKGLRHLEDSWLNTEAYGSNPIPWDAMPSKLPYEATQEYWCVEKALDFIDRREAGDRPFCLQIAFQRPHHPLLPQQRFWDLYPEDLDLPPTLEQDPAGRPPHFRKAYEGFRKVEWDFAGKGEPWIEGARRAWRGTLACVSQVDDCFGRLLAGLEGRGLRGNTIIVYHADHGAYHGTHGLIEKAPGICSEEVCRVPMIWQAPGVTKPGHVSHQLAENLDLGPTFAALCGLPEMEWADGHDLSPLIAGGGQPVRGAAVTENPLSRSIRWSRWRFVHYNPELFPGKDVGELYDLEADPNESRNLYDEPDHAPVVAEGRRKLLEHLLATTRIVSSHPNPAGGPPPIAADGKENRSSGGPTARIRAGNVNYL